MNFHLKAFKWYLIFSMIGCFSFTISTTGLFYHIISKLGSGLFVDVDTFLFAFGISWLASTVFQKNIKDFILELIKD